VLKDFLDNKPLFYEEIDYDRFPHIYSKIKQYIRIPKIIHLVGTNGKGTTGRFLATALFNEGYSVGHYTSPHILKFNERIWINSKDISDELLQTIHEKLLNMLDTNDAKSLSYFEYTTLLAMLSFESCEYVVLEAGLGGEYDATSVFPKELTLVTPIDIDHEAFLGSSIQDIATTKLNAIQNNAIIAEQKYAEVYDVASQLQITKKITINKVQDMLSASDKKLILELSKELKLATYLEQNLALSMCTLTFLGIRYSKVSFKDSRLFGRLTQFHDNVIIDVGHNVLAARSIVEQLRPNKYILIYNSYKDKNYKEILSILKPIIKSVQIIDIDEKRVVSLESLHEILIQLKIEYTKYNKINKTNNYLVFGSFSVAESFLREHNE